MTIKALEAAAQALWDFARPDGSPKLVADLRADAREIVFARTADIISAFAQNISEEAAEACNGTILLWLDGNPNGQEEWVAQPEQIRAAIEKDLE